MRFCIRPPFIPWGSLSSPRQHLTLESYSIRYKALGTGECTSRTSNPSTEFWSTPEVRLIEVWLPIALLIVSIFFQEIDQFQQSRSIKTWSSIMIEKRNHSATAIDVVRSRSRTMLWLYMISGRVGSRNRVAGRAASCRGAMITKLLNVVPEYANHHIALKVLLLLNFSNHWRRVNRWDRTRMIYSLSTMIGLEPSCQVVCRSYCDSLCSEASVAEEVFIHVAGH